MNKFFRTLLTFLVCIYFFSISSSYNDWHFIDSVNLVFHEAGHTIFFFLGDYIRVLAGSAFQVAVPLLISIYFFINRQKISGAICLLWTGQSLLNVSVYANDAIDMQLPLLGGDSSGHDWNYLLSQAGILKYTHTIAYIIYVLGIAIISAGSIASIYYAWNYETQE